MHIRELTVRTKIAERQVRYLIAEGFVPPPAVGGQMPITAKIMSRQ